MSQTKIIFPAAALLAGFVLGNVTGSGGPDVGAMEDRLGARIDDAAEANAGLGEQLSGLEQQIAALGDRVGGIEDAVGANGEALAGITDSFQASVADMKTALAMAAAEQSEGLEDVMQSLSGLGEMEDEELQMVAAPAAAEAQEEEEEVEDPNLPAPDGLTPGQTASFEDGGLRVFVSRVAQGAAHVAINGLETRRIREGRARSVDLDGTPCLLTVDVVDRGHVQMSAACGDDLPDPVGSTVGHTVTLGDGAARVFVSAIDPSGETARIAVNGIDTVTVEPDSIIKAAEGCHVVVEGIDRGHIDLSYDCG